MYLSGAPLHVITLNLVEKYRKARGPTCRSRSPRAWTARTSPTASSLGFTPITTCTDLLRPGGYGRLPHVPRQPGGAHARAGRADGWATTWSRPQGQGAAAVAPRRARPRPLRDALLVALDAPDVRPARRAARGGGRSACTTPLVRAAGAAEHAAGGGQGHRRPALPGRGQPLGPAQDRLAAVAVRLHQLRQVRAGLPQRRELRLRDRRAATRARSAIASRRERWASSPASGSRSARRTRSRTSRTSATSAATATPSARRTAARISRSRASSARSTPGARIATATASSCLRQDDVDAVWGRIRGARVPSGGGPRARPGALHRRRDHARAAPQPAPAPERPARGRARRKATCSTWPRT